MPSQAGHGTDEHAMRLTALFAIALLLASFPSAASSAAASGRQATQCLPSEPIFVFETNEFWLNLHHFLYVLGRAQANMRDASAPPVASAPGEAERALPTLTDGERRAW